MNRVVEHLPLSSDHAPLRKVIASIVQIVPKTGIAGMSVPKIEIVSMMMTVRVTGHFGVIVLLSYLRVCQPITQLIASFVGDT